MVGCGSSNARSTDCTPDLVDDSSANETLRSSIKPATPLSDKLIPYDEISRQPTGPNNDACAAYLSDCHGSLDPGDCMLLAPCRDQKGSS